MKILLINTDGSSTNVPDNQKNDLMLALQKRGQKYFEYENDLVIGDVQEWHYNLKKNNIHTYTHEQKLYKGLIKLVGPNGTAEYLDVESVELAAVSLANRGLNYEFDRNSRQFISNSPLQSSSDDIYQQMVSQGQQIINNAADASVYIPNAISKEVDKSRSYKEESNSKNQLDILLENVSEIKTDLYVFMDGVEEDLEKVKKDLKEIDVGLDVVIDDKIARQVPTWYFYLLFVILLFLAAINGYAVYIYLNTR